MNFYGNKQANFFQRYNLMMFATFFLVALVSLAILYFQFCSRYEQEISKLKSDFSERVLTLDYFIRNVTNDVEILRNQSESYLKTNHFQKPHSLLLDHLEENQSKNYFHLDNLQPPLTQEMVGNLTGDGSLINRNPDFYRELEMALDVSLGFSAVKANLPNVAWVYYTSANRFVNIYPRIKSQEFRFSDKLYNEAYLLGLPENNPERNRFWTNAYLDMAGAGLMVTCGAPVYDEDKFVGTIGIDFTVYILNDFINNFQVNGQSQKNLFLIDRYNQLLAHPLLENSKIKKVQSAKIAFPIEIQEKMNEIFKKPPREVNKIGSYLVLYYPLENAPWKLVFWVSKTDTIKAAIANTNWAWLILIPGLALILAIANQLIHKEFIDPALKLVKHIENESKGKKSQATNLPFCWQPWFEKISSIFQENRSLLQQLETYTKELENSNNALQTMNKLQDEFLANTSHELRTPLNGMIGIGESMLDGATGNLTELQKKNLLMIVQSGHRLANLVNDILDFSKLRHRDIKLQIKPVSLRQVTQIVITLNQPLVSNRDLRLINAIPAELPPAKADENRLQQILHNLVGNAIKFTRSGIILVSAQLDSSNSQLIVSVNDTGIGIRKEKLDRIFQSFEQAEGSTSREYGGTGLGLAITKQLIELHGGEISVKSTFGVGSCFTFTLPVSQGKVDPNTPISSVTNLNHSSLELNPITSGLPFKKENEHKFKILVVDDEPVNLQVLVNHLSLYDYYAIIQATNGLEVLELINNGLSPDLIVLDVMMPKMTGYEVTKKLRDRFSPTELPILLLTAKTQVQDIVVGFDLGANDYLTKPITKEELLARIKTHLYLKCLQEENLKILEEANRNLEEKVRERTEELTHTLNNLKTAQKQLIESEKMAALGGLVAGVAHEINTPIGNSIMAASVLTNETNSFLNAYQNGTLKRSLLNTFLEKAKLSSEIILSNLNRAGELIQSFKQVAVDRTNEIPRTFPVKQYLEEILISLEPQLKKTNHTVMILAEDELLINSYPGAFSQVIINLVMNSIIHGFQGEEKGELSFNFYQEENNLIMEYWDNGCGIPPENMSKIFEPFFTTSRSQGGSGLGLHIIYNLITQKLQGTIDCESEVGKGTKFIIKLSLEIEGES